MNRPWKWPSQDTRAEAERLARHFGMPRAVASTLAGRGFRVEDDVESFLNPRLGRLADPLVLDDMDRAVERLWRAVDEGERIFVHGDYDVDGIAGAAFLARCLRAVGAEVSPFVPDRSDGYGVSEAGIAAAVRAGARVLLTVDNGVRAVAEVAAANKAGLDVVILDHHEPGETLPEAYAVVDPQRGGPAGPFRELAGVGVAAKFVHALAAARPGTLPGEVYREGLQLVALGTVADSVPLTGENRILVRHGLERLAKSGWAGIQALKAVARLDRQGITATDVAFSLAPRLNAAGRMGKASDALALLLEDDPAEAYRLAGHVDRLNAERREVEQRVTREALAQLDEVDPLPPVLVLWSDGWPVGVIGIAASRLLERFHRPVVLISLDGDTGRGSARSPAGFSLPDAFHACREDLLEYGGHAGAGGFGIRRGRLESFRRRMEAIASDAALDSTPEPLSLDAVVELDEVNADCVDWLQRLSPFGRGNPEPLLAAEKLVLAEDPFVVGKRHLRLAFAGGETRLRAIAFNQGDLAHHLRRGQRVDAAFHASFDAWRGGRHVQLVVRDLKPR